MSPNAHGARTLMLSLTFSTLAALAAGCGAEEAGLSDGAPGDPTPIEERIPAELRATLEATGEAEVIVELADATVADALVAGAPLDQAFADQAAADARARAYGTAKAAVLTDADPADTEVAHPYTHLPLLHVRVRSEDALWRLLGHPEVVRLHPDRAHLPTANENLALIGQPAAAAAGKTGAGTTVVVLDTGVNYTLPAFGSCTSPGVPASCRVAYAAAVAAGAGALDTLGHGTNVSGIVAAVAPGAKLAVLNVFQPGGSAYATDIIAGINWAIAHRAAYNVVAINMSLGAGGYAATCGTDVFASAVRSARVAGILSTIASGNDGFTNLISSPACTPDAVSVGAVYSTSFGGLAYSKCTDAATSADKITCFSNSASFLTLLAPGALITAAGSTMAGTSQAAPHVAGAVAVLRSALPGATADDVVARLVATGKKLTDPRNGVVKPRIDLAAAVAQLADTTPPTGTVAVNGGAYVRTTAVTLTLSATDPSGVASMCLSSTTSCTTWVPYATSAAFTLAAGAGGPRTVYARFRDARGNASAAPVSATVVYDVAPPTGGAVTAAGGGARVVLGWSGFADALSGVAGYVVVGAAGAAPASCAGTALYAGTAATFTHAALANNTTYGYRVCARDGAGNLSAGVTASARAAPESTPPAGTVKINAGAKYTRALAVTLTLAATDASGVTSMCLANGTTCTAWLPYASTKTWTLAAGTGGTRTVYAWFRDAHGNAMAAPVSATLVYDAVAPAGGSLTLVTSGGKVAASWGGFVDATSGVASYTLVHAKGATPPASCAAGTVLYKGTGLSFTQTGQVPGTTLAYRLCATDGAGNVSTGLAGAFVVR